MGFKCERCGRCCNDPSLYVMITHRDILRLESFLPNIDLFKVLAFYQVSQDETDLENRLMSPKIITNRGDIFLGLLKKDNHCIFLEKDSCQIYEYRPLVCRCFPYTFQIRGDETFWGYSVKAKEYCPGINGSEIDTVQLEEIATVILEESKEFKQLIQIWNHLAQNNLIDPTPELLLQFITGKIKLSIENLKNSE